MCFTNLILETDGTYALSHSYGYNSIIKTVIKDFHRVTNVELALYDSINLILDKLHFTHCIYVISV